MNACASATVAAPLAWVVDDVPDDVWLDDFAAAFFGAVCASAAQAASRTMSAERSTGDLQIWFENIAPPGDVTKLFSLAVWGGRMQIVHTRAHPFKNKSTDSGPTVTLRMFVGMKNLDL
jgi:hypothetical protein